MNKLLAEILNEFLVAVSGKAVFLFSTENSQYSLVEFSTNGAELSKDYASEKNHIFTESYLKKSNGFYSDTDFLSPVVINLEDTDAVLHIFPEEEDTRLDKLDNVFVETKEKLIYAYKLHNFSCKMKYADLLDFPVVVKDFKGNLRYCNNETINTFSSDYFELNNINKVYQKYFDLKSTDEFVQHIDDAISKGVSEIILSKANGTGTLNFKMVSKLIKENNLIIDTITRINSQIEVSDSFEEKFKELVEAYEGLAFFLDRNGYIQVINSSGAHLLGYKSQEIINKHFLEFVSEEDKAEIALTFQNILTSRKNMPFETKLKDNFDNKIPFQVFGNAVYNHNKVTGFLGFARDLSQIIKLEEKISELDSRLIEANRLISIEKDRAQEQINVLEEINKLKNEFISNVSHELRTPLASIVGFAETIISDTTLPDEMVMEFTEIILNEGKRLAKLINDILDFSKLENLENALNFEEFDLIPVVKEILSDFENNIAEKNISVSCEIPEAEIRISADREKLKRVFGIVISNSVKYNHSGGRITVIVKDFLKEFELIVIDTGTGIGENEIPKLFQKFNKLGSGIENQGSGFGLVTAKQIVEMHKGIIRVKSELKKGSTFIIRLPKK